MNWSDERYVKLYTRDTLTWLSLGFEARAVLALMLRKVNGAGVIETGTMEPARALALQIVAPVDVVRTGLAELIDHEVAEMVPNGVALTNFIEAQEATKTATLAKRDQRQRALDKRRQSQVIETLGASVPACPGLSSPVHLQPSPAQLTTSSPPDQLSSPPAQGDSRPKKAKKPKGQGDLPGVPPLPPQAPKPPTRIGALHAFFLEEREFRFTDDPPDGLGLPPPQPDQPPKWEHSAAVLSQWCALFPNEPESEQDRLIKGMIRLWLLEPYWASPVDKKTGQPSTPYPWGAFLTEGQWRKAYAKLTGDEPKAGAA